MASLPDPLSALPTSFRVRIGDEEVELLSGATFIGRDTGSCRIVVSDTLVSRRHARILCDGSKISIEDLGSLNGTRVNGILIRTLHRLHEGDRIGVGSQELVVGTVAPKAWDVDAPTGVLHICENCKAGYSAVLGACPECGTKNATTRPGARPRSAVRYTLGMMLEPMGKAILMNNALELDKLMRQAAVVVSDQLRDAGVFDADELHALGEAASWLSREQGSNHWKDWFARMESELIRAPKVTSALEAKPEK